MPPKNNTTLGPGMIYPCAGEGLRYLGSIYEAESLEETEETAEPWPKENPWLIKQAQEATFTGTTTALAEAFKAVGDVAANLTETFNLLWTTVKRAFDLYSRYPNKRVRPLALHAKKQRTRKKNMRRIARDLKREVK